MNSQSSRTSSDSSKRQPSRDELAREERGREVDEVPLVELRERERLADPLDVAVAKYRFRIRSDHARMRRLARGREQSRQMVGLEAVVVVEERDPGARCRIRPALAAAARGNRCSLATRRNRCGPQTSSSGRMRRTAGRDDQDLGIDIALCRNRGERVTQRRTRHAAEDDADLRRAHAGHGRCGGEPAGQRASAANAASRTASTDCRPSTLRYFGARGSPSAAHFL